jgi:hypothetical protein
MSAMEGAALAAVLAEYRSRLLYYADRFSSNAGVRSCLLLAAQNISDAIAHLKDVNSAGAAV